MPQNRDYVDFNSVAPGEGVISFVQNINYQEAEALIKSYIEDQKKKGLKDSQVEKKWLLRKSSKPPMFCIAYVDYETKDGKVEAVCKQYRLGVLGGEWSCSERLLKDNFTQVSEDMMKTKNSFEELLTFLKDEFKLKIDDGSLMLPKQNPEEIKKDNNYSDYLELNTQLASVLSNKMATSKTKQVQVDDKKVLAEFKNFLDKNLKGQLPQKWQSLFNLDNKNVMVSQQQQNKYVSAQNKSPAQQTSDEKQFLAIVALAQECFNVKNKIGSYTTLEDALKPIKKSIDSALKEFVPERKSVISRMFNLLSSESRALKQCNKQIEVCLNKPKESMKNVGPKT